VGAGADAPFPVPFLMRGNVQTLNDFHGGVNARDSAFDLTANQARDARNMVGATRGAVRTRYGCVTVGTAPAPIHTVHYSNEIPALLVGCTDGRIYNMILGSPSADLGPGVALPGTHWVFADAPQDAGATEGPVYLMTPVATLAVVRDGVFGVGRLRLAVLAAVVVGRRCCTTTTRCSSAATPCAPATFGTRSGRQTFRTPLTGIRHPRGHPRTNFLDPAMGTRSLGWGRLASTCWSSSAARFT
jgi:hypothetical protein